VSAEIPSGPGRARRGADEGFSLIELMVAILLGVIVTIAFGSTMRGALSSSRDNRFRQEATSVAMEQFEHARSLRWEDLSMSYVDSTAPLIDPANGRLLASATGLAADEDLLQCSGGDVEPMTTRTVGDVTYTTWTYVTEVTESLRRVVVLVTWEIDGNAFSHRSDSMISIVSAAGLSAFNQPMFPEAAVVANGNVALNGGHTSSLPESAHSASIWLNASFSDLNATVDGDIHAGGVVNASVENVYGFIEQNAGTPVNTPSVTKIEAWRADMRAAAQQGTVYGGNTVLADTTVTAPIYVQGTLEFQGAVHIAGSGPVYSTNLIRFQGDSSVTSDAAHLVSDATIVFESGAQYGGADPGRTGVISFAESALALQLRGGPAGTTQGLAYAPYGGATLAYGLPWHGAVVTGGAGTTGSVEFIGAATIEYPAQLLPTTLLVTPLRPPPPEVVSCG
jgi:prepilin-type N-terminal cleavage/methylation domain-containing protein